MFPRPRVPALSLALGLAPLACAAPTDDARDISNRTLFAVEGASVHEALKSP